MTLETLVPLIQQSRPYQEALQRARALTDQGAPDYRPPAFALELPAAVRPYVLAALQRDWPGPLLVLSGRPEQARHLIEQLRLFGGEQAAVHYFQPPDTLFYDRPPWDRQTLHARASLLASLSNLAESPGAGQGTLVATSVWALMTKTAPPLAIRRAMRVLRVGMDIPMYDLLTQVVQAGYEAAVVVEDPGTFAHRGSIIDLYPPNLPHPLRIDFFGDEIDSIRTFDPGSQRTLDTLQEAVWGPAVEALPEWGPAAHGRLQALELARCNSRTQQQMGEQIEAIGQGNYFDGLEYYLPYLYPRAATLLDYMPANALVLLDDLTALESAAAALENQATSLRANMERDGDLPPNFATPYLDWPELRGRLRRVHTVCLGYAHQEEERTLGEAFGAAPVYGGQIQEAISSIVELRDQGQRLVLVTRQAERMADLLRERHLYVTPSEVLPEPPPPGGLSLVNGILSEGFRLLPADLTVLTDAEILGWVQQQRRRPAPRRQAPPEVLIADLKDGDYVVHIDHGIGRYHGMARKSIAGLEREYMEIEYDAGDRLFVPIHHANRISRYLGADDREPRIHRLGGTEWALARGRAEKAVRDMARELLELYAQREVAQGHAFRPDTPWQHELEASFPYVETDDQLSALIQVKEDMEQPRPMDRLLVGDVGYGKTEVAVRAAFKAAMDGKQVAVLVPTTVLAQQHFYTFRRRLRSFPVVVEMLSRFRSPAEQEEVLRGLREGRVDVVIGTHRLLSKDVGFKDLGLVVVDEEQRFGVAHKERLKRLRSEVDVLTLTATPIPRTLHMSLSGIRDMSVIDTPPENRLAIKTTVAEFDEGLIRTAILREMDRGGQVYFVHNRVQDIDLVAAELQRIVPEAAIVIGHGQMHEDELAQVMLGFAQGEGDVLLCTTIIESGLDIPNVNTIIIHRAENLGLAQLYQLRGRIGRGIERGYAYLLYKPPLTEVARQRLQTIQEASELGAGFRVAMRDMEIRGAGEILGGEQHGHIAAIGFDLYARLLRRAIEEMQDEDRTPAQAARRAQDITAGEALSIEMGPSIDLPVSAYLPEEYLPDNNLRLRLYRRIARVESEEELDGLLVELGDRFGPPSEPVLDLLYVLRVRLLATEAGLENLRGDEREIVALLPLPLAPGTAEHILARFPEARARGKRVRLPVQEGWREQLLALLRMLGELRPVPQRA